MLMATGDWSTSALLLLRRSCCDHVLPGGRLQAQMARSAGLPIRRAPECLWAKAG